MIHFSVEAEEIQLKFVIRAKVVFFGSVCVQLSLFVHYIFSYFCCTVCIVVLLYVITPVRKTALVIAWTL